MSNLNDHLLTSEESRVLAKIYESSNYLEINKSRPIGKPDSRIYSMDLALLKEYLNLIEEEMLKKGIKEMGVKITLGKYPEKSDNPKIKKEYLGYQTLFFSALDLGEPTAENVLIGQKIQSIDNTEDIPDLNYMSLTPP